MPYVREKSFKDLKMGLLRVDFFIPNKNIGIEVDGIYHFENIRKNRGAFLRQCENDRRKNSYFLGMGYKLYRIPYWEIPAIKTFEDCLQDKFLVKSKWHNDELKDKHRKDG